MYCVDCWSGADFIGESRVSFGASNDVIRVGCVVAAGLLDYLVLNSYFFYLG